MAEKEIKISFPEAKMEALEFFLSENNTTVEDALKEQLDKIYEKNVPQQVKKFVEREVMPRQEQAAQEESVQERPAGRGRRNGRQNSRQSTERETVREQNHPDVQTADEEQVQENGQEQESGMTMAM